MSTHSLFTSSLYKKEFCLRLLRLGYTRVKRLRIWKPQEFFLHEHTIGSFVVGYLAENSMCVILKAEEYFSPSKFLPEKCVFFRKKFRGGKIKVYPHCHKWHYFIFSYGYTVLKNLSYPCLISDTTTAKICYFYICIFFWGSNSSLFLKISWKPVHNAMSQTLLALQIPF